MNKAERAVIKLAKKHSAAKWNSTLRRDLIGGIATVGKIAAAGRGKQYSAYPYYVDKRRLIYGAAEQLKLALIQFQNITSVSGERRAQAIAILEMVIRQIQMLWSNILKYGQWDRVNRDQGKWTGNTVANIADSWKNDLMTIARMIKQ